MIRFYSLNELYNNNDINSDFLCSFNHLTDSAKKIVLAKNKTLADYLELHPELKQTEAERLSATTEKIEVSETTNNIDELNKEKQIVGETVLVQETKNSQEATTKHISKSSEIDYDKLDFNKDIVYVNKLFIRFITNHKNKCPEHTKQKLRKTNVVINNKRRKEKVSLWACPICKRFYTWEKMNDIAKLKKMRIEFESIDWKNNK